MLEFIGFSTKRCIFWRYGECSGMSCKHANKVKSKKPKIRNLLYELKRLCVEAVIKYKHARIFDFDFVLQYAKLYNMR